MSKILSLVFLGILTVTFFTQATNASDLYIIMEINKASQKRIYDNIVTHSGLGKQQEDDYHLTVAQISNVSKENKAKLRVCLLNKLRDICKPQLNSHGGLTINIKDAGRYLVNRNYDSCPLVVFPCTDQFIFLKEVNKSLHNELASFNKSNQTNYQFSSDLMPENFVPHITLANTKWVNVLKMEAKDDNVDLNQHDLAYIQNNGQTKAMSDKMKKYRGIINRLNRNINNNNTDFSLYIPAQ